MRGIIKRSIISAWITYYKRKYLVTFNEFSRLFSYLKTLASVHRYEPWGSEHNLQNFDFQLFKDIILNLKKTFCKYFYELFVEEIKTSPTVCTTIKSWRENCPIQNNDEITRDNKLTQFYFKLLHQILVTNKELGRFGITVKCVLCGEMTLLKFTMSLSWTLMWRVSSMAQQYTQN